jgi:hypothetical protein
MQRFSGGVEQTVPGPLKIEGVGIGYPPAVWESD